MIAGPARVWFWLVVLVASSGAGEHWAYVAPKLPPIPRVRDEWWCRSDLDRFIAAEQERHGLTPAAPADDATLARRVSLDLTGLPFTGAPEPYEQLVDRLLASPRFGERWASVWLDLARYADTQGYEKDNLRTIWPYRDWVIKAFNDDLPFDQFTIEQLAGDLLPHPTADQLTATAFHRNTLTNTEGGTDEEEFRMKAVIDRVNTTWTVWMGTTFACAQCHDHPTEPVAQREYYEFLACFNNTADANHADDRPLLKLLPIAQRGRAAELKKALETAQESLAREQLAWKATLSALGSGEWRALGEVTRATALRIEVPAGSADRIVLSHFDAVLVTPLGAETPLQFAEPEADQDLPGFPVDDALGREARNRHGWGFSPRTGPHEAVFPMVQPAEVPTGARIRVKLDDAFEGREAALPICTITASEAPLWTEKAHPPTALNEARNAVRARMSELDQLPETTVPVMQELPPAQARVTHALHRGNWLDPRETVVPAVPAAFPPMHGGDRLAVARWMVAPENPLVARVMVNRLWARLFGVGIVETEEDFGRTGTRPVNQELLDCLAVHFQTDWHWSTKRLLRELVLSATYRQSSAVTSAIYAADPQNRWLARGARVPLSAEMVRDQALSAAGLLSSRMYGPGVMPPQPEGVWQVVYSAQRWTTSPGENRFRRGLYTFWRRTSPYPGLALLDAPTRETCAPRRQHTASPAAALVTLNDPVYTEAAQALARRMELEGGATPRERVSYGWKVLLGNDPGTQEMEQLLKLWSRDPVSAATALLNLDAVLMKE